MGAVQRHLLRRLRRARNRLENLLPDSPSAPAIEAIIHRRVRAVFGWTVLPTTSALEHMDDPAQNPSIIPRLLARSIHWSGNRSRIKPRILQMTRRVNYLLASCGVDHRPIPRGPVTPGPLALPGYPGQRRRAVLRLAAFTLIERGGIMKPKPARRRSPAATATNPRSLSGRPVALQQHLRRIRSIARSRSIGKPDRTATRSAKSRAGRIANWTTPSRTNSTPCAVYSIRRQPRTTAWSRCFGIVKRICLATDEFVEMRVHADEDNWSPRRWLRMMELALRRIAATA
jgi:hypothetical protein